MISRGSWASYRENLIRLGRFATRWGGGTGQCASVTISTWTSTVIERSLRTVVLGRKNYLFCESDTGGEHAAAIYGVFGTAELNGLNTLKRTSSHQSHQGIAPWNLTAIRISQPVGEMASLKVGIRRFLNAIAC